MDKTHSGGGEKMRTGMLTRAVASGLILPPAFIVLCLLSWLVNRPDDLHWWGIVIRTTTLPIAFVWATALVAIYFFRSTGGIARGSALLAVTVVVAQSIPFFQSAVAALRCPLSLNTEGYVYRAALLLAEGRPIYHSFANPIGGIDAVYTPLFYVTLAALMKAFPPGLYLYRCLTLMATMGALALIWRNIFRETGKWWPALAACLLPTSVDVGTYLYSGRTDALAWFFSLAAYTTFRETEDSGATGDIRPLGLYGTAALCLLATMTKQSYGFGPAAIATYLLFRGRWGSAVRFAVAFAGPLIALTALLSWLTQGRYWFLVYGIHQYFSYSWQEAWVAVGGTVRTFALLSVFLLAWLWKCRKRPSRRLLTIYLLFSLANLLLATRGGASYNYLIEPVGLFSMAWGLSLDDLFSDDTPAAAGRAGVLIGGVLSMCFFVKGWLPDLITPREIAAGEALVRLIQRLPRPSLADDPYLLVRAGQSDNSVEWYIETTLKAVFPQRRKALLTAIASGKYNMIFSGNAFFKAEDFEPALDSEVVDLLEKRFRRLRPDEFLPNESAVNDCCLILVPCESHCGFLEPLSEPIRTRGNYGRGSYRAMLRWLLGWFTRRRPSR